MPKSNAEYQATYRARHPERIAAYKARPESKAREAAWMKAKRAADPEGARRERLRLYAADPLAGHKARMRFHGMTPTRYAELMEEQGDVCAICRSPETARGSNGRTRRLAVDHNHETGAIRGLLCHACNVALGYVNDNPELLEAAAGYLRAALRRADLRIQEA